MTEIWHKRKRKMLLPKKTFYTENLRNFYDKIHLHTFKELSLVTFWDYF